MAMEEVVEVRVLSCRLQPSLDEGPPADLVRLFAMRPVAPNIGHAMPRCLNWQGHT